MRQTTSAGLTAALGLALALCVAFGGVAFAQGIQSGVVSGKVTSSDGQPLPGVTITLTSPALQGVRTAVSTANGDYIFKGLPPGAYSIRFELEGFADVERAATVALGGTIALDASLALAARQETVVVTAERPSALSTAQAGANYTGDEIDSLATGRTLQQIAELAPGLTDNTPNAGQVTISGAFAYDNVFLVDGVDVNDNFFGSANDLYIEDAIEETQVLTSGISAEYGRFSGGVVNAVTKRGGNRFSGSFRTDLSNPAWQEETPFEKMSGVDHKDDISEVFQATLGGPIVRDRLWFFTAGRREETTEADVFRETGVAYDRLQENTRYEVKLTGNLHPNHALQGSYTRNTTDQTRPSFSFSIDPAVIEGRSLPNDLVVANYKGVLSSRFFAEAQYSQRQFGFRDSGGTSRDIADSPFLTRGRLPGVPPTLHYNAPYFDATDPQDRDNRQFTGNLSYFLSTGRLGSHDLKVGVEHFTSIQVGGNSQSATDYVFQADYKLGSDGRPALDGSGRLIPVFVPGVSRIQNWLAARGARLEVRTLSLFLNNRWSLNRHWSINAGARYEKVRSEATGGLIGVDTDAIVPRLAASYDPKGDGKVRFDATYAHYSGGYNPNLVGSNTNVLNPDLVLGVYRGPAGEGRDFGPGLDRANYETVFGSFGTANVFLEDGLSAPITKEFTLAGGVQLGHRGYAKLIYSWRKVDNFIEDFITIDNSVTTVLRQGIDFGTFDNIVYRNTDLPRRDYQALQLQARYRITDDWWVTGHYTLQLENDGNYEGEAVNQPGIPTVIGDFPEVHVEGRNYPTGRLDDFQRHKARVWTSYSLGLGRAGNLDLDLLWRFDSALTYSLAATGVPFSAVQLARDPGYRGLSDQTLFFGPRGSGDFERAHLFDAALTYEVPVFRSLKPWVKLDLRNAFNNDSLIRFNTAITPDFEGRVDTDGLPTNFMPGPSFGQGTSNLHYPIPRELRLSAGFRF